MARPSATALALLFLATSAHAQVTVRARLDTPQTRVGRTVDLSVEAQGTQNLPAPQVPTPRGVTIRYVGPSTQLSIVNGRTSATITHHFAVVAQAPGRYPIGPITVDHDGQHYDAGTVILEAIAAGAADRRGGEDPLALTLSAAKTDVYLYERLPLKIALRVGNVRVTDVEFPALPGEGYALEKFGQPTQREEQTPQGTVTIAEFATTLTPLRSGPLAVGPAQLSLVAVTRGRGRQDPFFGQFFGGQREQMQLTSERLDLNVLPLPDEGKPPDFSGAVGTFELDVRATPIDVQAGDPITLRTTIRGRGNLEQVTPPTVVESETLRVYPAQPANEGATPQPGAPVEQKIFEQVVIPQKAGPFSLPALRFSYFDPETRAYRTITHPAIPLTVRPATRGDQPPAVVGAPPAAPQKESLGRDIVFIKDAPGTLRPIGARWHRSVAFWVLQLLPLAAWLAVVVYDRRRRRLHGDAGYARYTRAGREAKQALAAARGALQRGDRVAFYDAVAAALRDYLSAKLDLPPGSITLETVARRLQGNTHGPRVADELRELFDVCERVRFAPSADGERDMAATLDRAEKIVRDLERTKRVAPPLAAAIVLAMMTVAAASPQPPVGAAAGGGDNPSALFFQGNALYSSERYADAAATYERILTAGRESGNLYFNLGNAYFRSGDVGRAILNYERARRLIPGDPDLRANLTFAQTAAGIEETEPLYARLLFPLARRLSTDMLLVAASVTYLLVVLLLILGRLAPAAARATTPTAIVATVAIAVLVGSAVYRLTTVDLPDYAVVVAPGESTVRFEPSATGTAHFTAKNGMVLKVLATRQDWAQVSRTDGQRGWIERSAVETVRPS